MEPKAFLTQTIPGFANLSDAERTAIADFTLLWSVMEGKVLHANATPATLLAHATTLAQAGTFPDSDFQTAFEYFANRYIENGTFSYHYQWLHVHKYSAKNRALVEAALLGQKTDADSQLSALLLIVLRLRNNLFHGEKWVYELRGQFDNFTHSNRVLMRLVHLHAALNGPF